MSGSLNDNRATYSRYEINIREIKRECLFASASIKGEATTSNGWQCKKETCWNKEGWRDDRKKDEQDFFKSICYLAFHITSSVLFSPPQHLTNSKKILRLHL